MCQQNSTANYLIYSLKILMRRKTQSYKTEYKKLLFIFQKIKELVADKIENITIETDNKAIRKSVNDVVNKLFQEALFKISCLQACQNGFIVKDYLDVKAKASIDNKVIKPSGKKSSEKLTQILSILNYTNVLKHGVMLKQMNWIGNYI